MKTYIVFLNTYLNHKVKKCKHTTKQYIYNFWLKGKSAKKVTVKYKGHCAFSEKYEVVVFIYPFRLHVANSSLT